MRLKTISYAWLMKPLLFTLLCFVVSSALGAQTGYRLVHPDGTVEYSDVPIPGGDAIKLREAPTIKMAPPLPSPATKDSAQGRAGSSLRADGTISITSPRAGQTLWFDEAGVTVSVTLSPPLQSGQQISISLDGRPVASGSGTAINIGQVYRGSHTVSASVVDSSGKTLLSSPAISFHLRQYSAIGREPPPSNAPSPTTADEFFGE